MLKCVIRGSEEQCFVFHHIDSMAVERTMVQHRSLLRSECASCLSNKHHRDGSVPGIGASIEGDEKRRGNSDVHTRRKMMWFVSLSII